MILEQIKTALSLQSMRSTRLPSKQRALRALLLTAQPGLALRLPSQLVVLATVLLAAPIAAQPPAPVPDPDPIVAPSPAPLPAEPAPSPSPPSTPMPMPAGDPAPTPAEPIAGEPIAGEPTAAKEPGPIVAPPTTPDPTPALTEAPRAPTPPAPAPSPLPQSAAAPLTPATPESTPIVRPRDLPKEPPLPTVDVPQPRQATAELGDQAALPRQLVKDFEPISFQDLQAGKSTAREAKEKLGEPLQKTEVASATDGEPETIWSYKLGPFPRVELAIRDGVVHSLFVKVADLPDPKAVARQLQIDHFRGGVVFSPNDEPLGVVYPERGVMFSLRERQLPDGAIAGYGVYSILLEPINAELFVTRARNTKPDRCTQRIADLDLALELSPKHAEACGLKARILASIGETREAVELAEDAVALDPTAVDWRLLAARLSADLGDVKTADEAVDNILSQSDLPAVLRAEALMLKGHLLAIESDHDKALEFHKKAIELAAPFRKEESAEVRRAALRVLANGHLAVANDIAWGAWQRKADVVPLWVKSGHQFADILISDEGEEKILAQRVQRLTLSAYAGFAEWIDPSEISRETLKQGRELIAEAKDPLHRQRIEWELAETMYYSMMAERRRGSYESALEFAQVASPLFESTMKRRSLSPRERYLVGQLYFLAGSCLAVEAERHEDAVRWYDQGANLLLQPFPPSVVEDPAELGDQLVSMGVSYWRSKRADHAVKVTMRGAALLQQAYDVEIRSPVASTKTPRLTQSLKIAYSNLSAMLRASNRPDEAVRWDERLTDLRRSISR